MDAIVNDNSAGLTKPLGICLSGGGALGFAHIGVLQALLENGIEPQVVSGSSMGAIVGTFYAAGFSPEEMMQIIRDDRLFLVSKLMKFKSKFWKSGFSTHYAISKLMGETIPHDNFDKLKRKMHVCVANMNTMQWEIKSKGKGLASWVSASSSIPGVFESYEKDGVFYLDGGILNNLPAQPLKDSCRAVIGVDIFPFIPPVKMVRSIDAITSTIRGIQHLNSLEGRSVCKYIIEPTVVKRFHEFRFEAYHKIYRQGYKDTLEFIKANPEIRTL